jgi:hypothetical protein
MLLSMPWTPSDAKAKTHKADTPKKQRQWRDVANSALERTGDEATAIKEANAVVGKTGPRYKPSKD